MDRHQLNRGFALAEVMAVFLILSVLMMLSLPAGGTQAGRDSEFFWDHYLRMQSEAILCSEERTVEEAGNAEEAIHFNSVGNVNLARTLIFDQGSTYHEIVVELGGGRLVEKEGLSSE